MTTELTTLVLAAFEVLRRRFAAVAVFEAAPSLADAHLRALRVLSNSVDWGSTSTSGACGGLYFTSVGPDHEGLVKVHLRCAHGPAAERWGPDLPTMRARLEAVLGELGAAYRRDGDAALIVTGLHE